MQSANAMRRTAVYADHTHQKTASANRHIENKTNILGWCRVTAPHEGRSYQAIEQEPNEFGSEIGA